MMGISIDLPNGLPFKYEAEECIENTIYCIIPNGWVNLLAVQDINQTIQNLSNDSVDDVSILHRLFWDADTLSSAFESMKKSVLKITARYGLAMIAIACERYYIKNGSYPESIETLVPEYLAEQPIDPYSGKPFIYLPAGTKGRGPRPTIYSIGPNQIDGGGYEVNQTRLTDFVWQYQLPDGFTKEDFFKSKLPVK